MLMDLFYKRAAVAKKKRVHFNSFMLDIHNSMYIPFYCYFLYFFPLFPSYISLLPLSLSACPSLSYHWFSTHVLLCPVTHHYSIKYMYIYMYTEIHQFKKDLPRSSAREKPHAYDPIAPVARDVASNAHLLCFDEFQVRRNKSIGNSHQQILIEHRAI